MGDANTTETITPTPEVQYEHMSMICPNCEHEGLRTQYGTYVCDGCSAAYGYNYATAWNKGFKAGAQKARAQISSSVKLLIRQTLK